MKSAAKICNSSSWSPAAWRAPTWAPPWRKVQQTVAGLHLPASVRVEYGGTYEEQQKSFHDLLRVLLLALALVFGVLLTEFRNFPAPIAILTSSVLSISGVILALLVTRTTFNVASFMGLIMVIGIVAKNGILLLDADEKFRAEGASARDAMLHAAQRRLRPIVMTAIAAVCGMLPWPSPSAPARRCCSRWPSPSSAASRISMVLSLVVTPLVYFLLTRHRESSVGGAADHRPAEHGKIDLMSACDPILLTAAQARVLGALVEKEVTTPDYYPLSLNALINACNQRSNREPVMNLDEDDVRQALHGLEDKRLAGRARSPTAASPSTSTGWAKPSTSAARKQRCSACCCCAVRRLPANCAAAQSACTASKRSPTCWPACKS